MKSLKAFKSLQSKALALILGILLIAPHNVSAMGGEIVFDPTTYASILESIEKYNTMIKNMQDTLDTMNRINDVMNTASNQLNNLQTGLADPRQLVDRFQSNLQNIQDNANRIAKNLEKRDWVDTFITKEYATCKTKWQNLLKEYAKQENAKGESELEKGTDESGEISDEAKEKANAHFTKSAKAQEINMGFKYLDTVNNEGLQAANDKIHGFFNEFQSKIDLKNNESLSIEAAMGIKNKYEYQKNLCAMVEKEWSNYVKKEALSCYNKAVKNKDKQEAERCLNKFKEQRENDEKTKIEQRRKTLELANKGIFKIQNDGINKPVLKVDVNSGELSPQQVWKDKTGKNKKEEIAEPRNITIGSGDNQSTRKIWIVKQDIINHLFEVGEYAEALNLQNDRNMALAMGSDTYALTQAQAETLTMISKQMVFLNDSISTIGKMVTHFLEDQVKSQEKNQQPIKENSREQLKKFNVFDSEEKLFYYNDFGIPKMIRKKRDDNSSILD